MKTVNKTELLSNLEMSVEAHLQEAISRFQNMTDDALLKPSESGGWSIAQCLEHLNSYGHYYLPEFKKGLDKQNGKANAETFTSTWLGNYFTRMMHPETGMKKFKAFKNHTPGVTLDAHAVIAEFIAQQETLLALLKRAMQVDLNKVRIPLSIFEWATFKLGDAFRFLIAHNERHILQAKRNMT